MVLIALVLVRAIQRERGKREREREINNRNWALIAIINYVIVNEVKYEKSFDYNPNLYTDPKLNKQANNITNSLIHYC